MRNFYKLTYLLLLSVCAKAQVPSATIVSGSSIFCTGVPLSFSAITATDVTLQWRVLPAKAVSSLSAGNNNVTFSVSNAGTYTINLLLSNSSGTASVSKTFNAQRTPTASFNDSLSGEGFPAQLMLSNYSQNARSHYWYFDGNLQDSDTLSTLVKNYTAAGSHTVTLVAQGSGGCNDISSYAFRLADSSGVTLPNVFTPNGDGVNDVYKPSAKGLVSIHMWIYNRHGLIIASWDKINGFWDGYTTSGEPADAGEYFAILEAAGFDGMQYKLKSVITLLR